VEKRRYSERNEKEKLLGKEQSHKGIKKRKKRIIDIPLDWLLSIGVRIC
jgi:hypothetical protein